MPDDGHHKVISILQRHKKGEQFRFPVEEGGELVISPDGFHYVSFKTLCENGKHWSEEDLLEMAEKRHYIIKLLEHHRDTPRLNHYHVPGNQLEQFLASRESRPGKILSIEPFWPEAMA